LNTCVVIVVCKANIFGKRGACGFTPAWNQYLKLYPVVLIKIDANMNPIRDKNGFCISCSPGEKGLLIGLIGSSPLSQFNGYANDANASSKKIVENVFKSGQKAFNSGDLMVCDNLGYIYFCDRLGDTYRWKGENVSTLEVENIISSKLNSTEIVVYGVTVPGQEGRAGMACILDNNNFSVKSISKHIVESLPSYARPLFLRFAENIEHTGKCVTEYRSNWH
jgi:solute carrier family 27 fatty acid transporter 1/4